MKTATILGFFDEFEKIKEASFMRDVGMKILSKARNAPAAMMAAAKAVPGAAAGAVQNAGNAVSAFSTPVESFKRGLQMSTKDFSKMHSLQKGLMLTGLAGSAHEALAKEDPLRQGRGRVERAATAVGDQLGGIIGTPFGVTGGIVAGQIGRKAGKLVGKGAEAVHRSLKKPKPETP